MPGPDTAPPAEAPSRVVFLDAGETLLYAHPSSPDVMVEVAAAAGIQLDPTAVREVTGRLWPEVDALVAAGEQFTLSLDRSRRFWDWYYRRLLSDLEVPAQHHAALAEAFYARFTDLDTWVLYDDVLDCLRHFRSRGLTLGLISNWESWLEALLHHRQISHYFDAVVISGQVGAEKPDAAIFRQALDLAGVPAAQAVHIGDSLPNDVEAARAVGIRPILLTRDGGQAPPTGVAAVRSLTDLPRLLGVS